METTSPRNSQLKLIEADERWGGHNSCPGVFLSKHRIDRFPMPQKTHRESCRVAASTVCAASCASNSAGET